MICDYHVYFDEGYLDINNYLLILKNNKIDQAILSPPCTSGKEPKKSDFMYFLQRKNCLIKLVINFQKKYNSFLQ